LRPLKSLANHSTDTADSSDHPGSAQAIADGLRSTHSASNPAYYIHISGTAILTWYDYKHNRYGQKPLPEQAYDDLDGLDAIKSIPDEAWHRDVDKIVIAEAAKDPAAVKIAVICPPTIYGVGRGPINQRSRQVPLLIAVTLQDGAGPVIGDGLTEWDNVHIHDLSDHIALVAQHANLAEPSSVEQEVFGPNGYHFCENGTHRWSEIADLAVKEANKQGLVNGKSTKKLPVEVAKEKYGTESLTWGLNSRGAARRARKFLGWKPKGPSLAQSIPEMVRHEDEKRKGK
jgi:nucleoside-diphosphate-sugar epimerase